MKLFSSYEIDNFKLKNRIVMQQNTKRTYSG